MKTLLLLRHGKSSWDDPELEDHDRPLKPRGRKGAKRAGRWIRDSGIKIDLVLCSTAMRARETWSYAGELLRKFPVTEYLQELYHCTAGDFVKGASSRAGQGGHGDDSRPQPRPGRPASQAAGEQEAFPTAALAKLSCPIKSWSQFETDVPCTLDALVRTSDTDS